MATANLHYTLLLLYIQLFITNIYNNNNYVLFLFTIIAITIKTNA